MKYEAYFEYPQEVELMKKLYQEGFIKNMWVQW